MKHRTLWLSLLAAGLALPGALRAQDEPCPCRRPGMIGVAFSEDSARRVVVITDVRRGSPAEEAGVREGDVVVRLNGQTATFDRFGRLPLDLQAGDTVRLRLRGGQGGGERDVVVVAQARPFGPMVFREPMEGARVFELRGDSLRLEELTIRLDSLHSRLRMVDPEHIRIRIDTITELLRDTLVARQMFRLDELNRAQEMALRDGRVMLERLENQPFLFEVGMRAAAGAELAPMNEGLARYFRVDEGALVLSVGDDTPAARAGLQAGDVIVSVGGDEVEDPSDFRRSLMSDEDRRMEIGIVRQGRRQTLTLEWERPEGVRRFRSVEPSRRRSPRK
ncbi:MAG TPA: PDZ domain-containing protein [Longimicrobium sp.]|nr:PDZ domain-containing protein [Longimicrobium sp.]